MQGDLADLVEEERSIPLRQRQAAHGVRDGAGEGAPLVTEEGALDELLRQRGAVDRDERARRAGAVQVQRASDELLPGSRRADDERRATELRHRANLVAEGPHDVALSDEPHPIDARPAGVAELEAEKDPVANRDARAGREERGPGDARHRGGLARVEADLEQRPLRGRDRIDLEALDVGAPADVELLAADLRVIEGVARLVAPERSEEWRAASDREPLRVRDRRAERDGSEAAQVAMIEQAEARLSLSPIVVGSRRPAVVAPAGAVQRGGVGASRGHRGVLA